MKLGEYLRSERVGKGIDIDTAAEETRIKDVYIRAMEDEKWELIPGEIYQRHYLKTYLEYLGHEDLYYRLTRERPKPAQPSERMVRKPTEDAWDTSRYVRVLLRVGLVVIFIVVVLWLGAMAMARVKHAPREAQPSPTEDVVEELAIPLPLPSSLDPVDADIAQALGPPANLGNVGAQIEGAFDTHTIKIEAKGECWLSVSGPDGMIFKGLLKEGDTKEYGPDKHFIITVGKPENVLVYFDTFHIYGGDKGLPPGMTFSLPADLNFDKAKLNNDLADVTGGN